MVKYVATISRDSIDLLIVTRLLSERTIRDYSECQTLSRDLYRCVATVRNDFSQRSESILDSSKVSDGISACLK